MIDYNITIRMIEMKWKVKGKSYYFDKDFKELSASKRIKVVKMVRNLLKIQKEDKAMLADAPIPHNEAKQEGLA
jgi:hypothetical protein